MRLARTRHGRSEHIEVSLDPYPYPEQHLEVEERMVHLNEADLARVERENQQIALVFAARGPRLFDLPLGAPLERLSAGSRFGARRFFNGEPRSPHGGADYQARSGTPVLAAAAGRVVLAEEHFFAGQSVYLDHGDGLISMYFHLSEIAVEEGRSVERGERIGSAGATGRATGPHLHFGLRWRGARIDPAMLLGKAVPTIGD